MKLNDQNENQTVIQALVPDNAQVVANEESRNNIISILELEALVPIFPLKSFIDISLNTGDIASVFWPNPFVFRGLDSFVPRLFTVHIGPHLHIRLAHAILERDAALAKKNSDVKYRLWASNNRCKLFEHVMPNTEPLDRGTWGTISRNQVEIH